VATIICYAPQAIRTRISCFALSGEVSLIQTDHVSSEEPACNTHTGSATPAPLLTKLVSPVRCISRRWLVSSFSSLSRPTRRSGACARSLTGSSPRPRSGACARGLTRSSWFSYRTRRDACARSLTRSSRDLVVSAGLCLCSKLNRVSEEFDLIEDYKSQS
jgi:hypothetical protein